MALLACSLQLQGVDEGEQQGAGRALVQGFHWPKTTRAMQTQPRPEMTPKV
jgi:hypothetical protein